MSKLYTYRVLALVAMALTLTVNGYVIWNNLANSSIVIFVSASAFAFGFFYGSVNVLNRQAKK